ncbi:hypothetical protein AM571_CH03887 [Rhizobium etli 8C-3]|uniref:Uncharacterized protein n=1 Tax=Rhizobium etli 8C-3 TaxID=538025 RepID=A0A1L5P923_RHIET|nr:hypothetical protein AM571_CH03887 [Rhizobium etli 8C-3]
MRHPASGRTSKRARSPISFEVTDVDATGTCEGPPPTDRSIVTRGENDDKAARNCGKIAAYAAAPSFNFLATADAARQVFRLTGMSAV